MSLNLDALRKKLDKLNGTKKASTDFKPEIDKTYRVRLVPWPNNDGQPFKEVQWYYNIPGLKAAIAPYQFGQKDPVQDLMKELHKRAGEGDKGAYEMRKKLFPSMRTYAGVIVRGDTEDEGVKIWSFGKTIYQQLLGYLLDEDYGDITDPISGRDLKITVTKNPKKDYADTAVTVVPATSPLSKDKEKAQKWLASFPDMSDRFKPTSADDLSAALEKWINSDVDPTDEPGVQKGGAAAKKEDEEEIEIKKPSKSTKAPEKADSDIDDAFDDLMKDS